MINNILSTLTVLHSSSGGLNLFSKIKRTKNFKILKAKINSSKFRQVKKKHRKFLFKKRFQNNINACLKVLYISSLVIVVLNKYFLALIGQKF